MHAAFSRNPVFPIIMLIPAVLFGFTTILQFSMGSPVAFFTLIAAALFFINSIWSFNTPIVKIDATKLFVNEALFKQKEYLLTDIEKFENPKPKLLLLHIRNKSVTKIRLDLMKSDDRSAFLIILKDVENE